MPRRTNPQPASSLPEQLTEAATAFTRELLRIIGGTTLTNLCAIGAEPGPRELAVARQVSNVTEGEGRAPRPGKRTNALRRAAGTRPVSCPVPGCESKGVRSKMNFCSEHAASLPAAKKNRLRQHQRESHIAQPIDVASSSNKGRPKSR
jgi:hypothetical protein